MAVLPRKCGIGPTYLCRLITRPHPTTSPDTSDGRMKRCIRGSIRPARLTLHIQWLLTQVKLSGGGAAGTRRQRLMSASQEETIEQASRDKTPGSAPARGRSSEALVSSQPHTNRQARRVSRIACRSIDRLAGGSRAMAVLASASDQTWPSAHRERCASSRASVAALGIPPRALPVEHPTRVGRE